MKKTIISVLMIAVILLTFGGCANKVKCMICKDKVLESDAKVTTIYGEEFAICYNCLNDTDRLGQAGFFD